MTSHQPAVVNLSLHEFVRHGIEVSSFRDGWGIALYRDRDAWLLKDDRAASSSDGQRWVAENELPSRCAISHVRQASRGGICFENTQPYCRELGGTCHTFAHNGTLAGYRERLPLGRFRPMGSTDSEHAFCWLLAEIESLWQSGPEAPPTPPSVEQRVEVLARIAATLRELGKANFLYSDHDLLFAHGHHGSVRTPATEARDWTPGLHWLESRSVAGVDPTLVDGIDITASSEHALSLVATVPLSSEDWQPLALGELAWFRQGRLLGRKR